jgi:hypothetical protein
MNTTNTPPEEHLPDPNDAFVRFLGQIAKVQHDQRLLILVSHGVLELLVNGLIDTKCKNAKRIASDSRGYPHSARLLILNEIGAISNEQLKQYDAFRRLRNRAAHDPLFSVTTSDLEPFSQYYQKTNLYLLCTAIVASLWNDHVPVLAARFLPSMSEAIQAEQRATVQRTEDAKLRTLNTVDPTEPRDGDTSS